MGSRANHLPRRPSDKPSEHTDSDAALVALLDQRDPDALTILLSYAPCLNRILTRRFGASIAPDDLDELVIETLLKAFNSGQRYDPGLSRPITWLSMLAHYQALQFLRTRQHLSDTTLDQIAECMAARAALDRAELAELPSARMEALISRLSKRRAAVVRMHYYDGLSLEQIADLLGISLGGTRSHLCRALGDLRRMLDHDCPENV